MTTPSTGSISFQDLIDEFGNPGGGNDDLGSFRVSQTVNGVTFNGIDEGVPSSGAISFNDLRGKSLNNVVSVTGGGTNVNAKVSWQNNNVTIIGNGRAKKQDYSRIFIQVKGTYSSSRGNGASSALGDGRPRREDYALKSGNWGLAVSVDMHIGRNGQTCKILGGGGDGGSGAVFSSSTTEEHDVAQGQNGYNGTSALEINHEIRLLTVENSGLIQAGGGGGGAGGGAGGELSNSRERVGGAGGGGGQGSPGGEGGSAGTVPDTNIEVNAQNGTDGSASGAGNGGNGGENEEEGGESSASSGAGGGGGGVNQGEGGTANTEQDDGFPGQEGNLVSNNPSPSSRFSSDNGKGGAGGAGVGRGTGQIEGQGGQGGESGYAIMYDEEGSSNADIGSFSSSANNRIYGRIHYK